MTREEFVDLPLKIAMGIIYDMARKRLEPMPVPDVPRPPRYDGRLSRGRKGFTWMSEMTLDDLQWWHGKKQESAESGGDYAEKDGKVADRLAQWIAWRDLYPSERWNGTRDNDRVTAAAPSRDATVHEWKPRSESGSNGAQQPQQQPKEEKPGYGF